MDAIEATDLEKRFADLTAIKGISFRVPQGETFGLLGPNGAGKTTTMRMLAGLSPISSGTLTVCGLDVAVHGRAVRHRLGVVTQADGLDTGLNVRQNLTSYGRLTGLGGREAAQRADEVLDFFMLSDKARSEVGDLSGGMKRRLAIARALLAEPDVVILDEPSTGLDPDSRLRVWEALAALKRRGVTLVMSTHYMDEAEMLCDRIAILHGGEILDIDTPEALVERHGGEPAVDVRATHRDRGELRKILTESAIPFREMGAVFRVQTHDAARGKLSALSGVSITERTPNLEDVFLNIAGRGLTDE
ncbi:MAG: ABC transporter ATP-binding protein [Pseudomonadota bacterium]